MNSRERLLTTLRHQEPDRVPFDLGGTNVSGIHVQAYRNLRAYLGLPETKPAFADVIQQIIIPDRDVFDRLQIDTRGLFPRTSSNWNITHRDVGDSWEYKDEWGLVFRFPKQGGHWYSLVKSPIDSAETTMDAVTRHPWPQPDEPGRLDGLREQATAFRQEGKVVILKGFCAGLVEMGERIRGMENFLCDILTSPRVAEAILEKVLELKIRFWDMALDTLGNVIDIVHEADDFGTQESQIISPQKYRELIKPRESELFSFLRKKMDATKAPGEERYIFFHSCGNIRPLIPDFIDLEIDIINPVHTSIPEMEPGALKRDFGADITFWGGGVDTQDVLPFGTPGEVRENVKRNIDALAPGGGYVFNTVHNIQSEVPPQNIMAMWEALQEFGRY
jgi:uroporphyrinogen decarboxylase